MSKKKPQPPKPPLGRVVVQGVEVYCDNCDSTMSRTGWLGLFGKRKCDNRKCPNSK